HLDEGFGVAAFEFRQELGRPTNILQARLMGVPEGLAELYPIVYREMALDIRELPFANSPCTAASQMLGQREEFREHPLMKKYAQRFGMYDSIWITAAEPSGGGCGLHAGRPKITWASARTIERWSRVAAHLSAAVRLRHRLRSPAGIASPESGA